MIDPYPCCEIRPRRRTTRDDPTRISRERLADDSRNDSRRTLELLGERLATIPAENDSRRSDPGIPEKNEAMRKTPLWGRRKRIGRGFNVCQRTYTKPMGKDCRYSKGTQMREIAEQKNGAFYVVKYCDLCVWTRACVLRIRTSEQSGVIRTNCQLARVMSTKPPVIHHVEDLSACRFASSPKNQ